MTIKGTSLTTPATSLTIPGAFLTNEGLLDPIAYPFLYKARQGNNIVEENFGCANGENENEGWKINSPAAQRFKVQECDATEV